MLKLCLKSMFCLLLGMAGIVHAGDKVDQTLAAQEGGLVEIHNIRGKIALHGWNSAQVQVVGELDDLAEEFVFLTQGDTTLIKVKLPQSSSYHNRDGSNLTINIPNNSKVKFIGVATDIVVSEISGAVSIESVSGDIKLNAVKGNTFVNNVSGNISLANLEGELDVSTVSGDIDADINCPKAKIRGVTSKMNLNIKNIKNLDVSNVSGQTGLKGTLSEESNVKMRSVSGETTMIVEEELDAQVSIETAPGGEINNQFNLVEPSETLIKSYKLDFKSGAGKGSINLSTVNGVVRLQKNNVKSDK
ncbi:DUF4097 family beta strand repeat-containing protein [Aliikangiella sp. IMCC44632]